MRLVTLLAIVSAVTPRVAHACSPGPLDARVFWPRDGVLPANGSVWLIRSGLDYNASNWMPTAQFKADDGSPITATVNGPVDLEVRTTQPALVMLIQVDAPLEPHRSYTLEYSSSSTATSQLQITTTEPDIAVPSPPDSIELMFSETGSAPSDISTCSSQVANEVSTAFLRPTAGTAWIRSSATWPDGSRTERPRLMFVHEIDQMMFTFWGADQGVPCVRSVAVGPGGAESTPVEVCQPSACGGRDSFYWSYQKWKQSGGPCEDSNTGCSSVRGDTSSGMARALLGLLRRVSSH